MADSSGRLRSFKSTYAAGLVVTAWLWPISAALAATALYLTPIGWPNWMRAGQWCVVGGSLIATVIWLAAAAFYRPYATAERANSNSYGQFHDHVDKLNSVLRPHCGPAAADDEAAYRTACEHWRCVQAQLQKRGLPWVIGTGYINVWQSAHRAEEALIDTHRVKELLDDAWWGEMRLRDSAMDQSGALLASVRSAKEFLRARCEPPWTRAWRHLTNKRPENSTPEVTCEDEARTALKGVTVTVNEFRDRRWAGIIRARNLLMGTVIVIGLTGYALLSVGLFAGAPVKTVVAIMGFYLIGALVGLFNLLSVRSSAGTAVDDYGLASVGLIATPFFSGLAGVAGVLLIGFISGGGVTDLLQPHGSSKTSPTVAIPPLVDVFDLDVNRIGLLVAAIFGLTPQLLVSRLLQFTERYKTDLRSTEAGGSASDMAKTPSATT